MGGTRQLRIVKVKKKTVERDRRHPQPHVSKYRPIKKFEILHRPFDLKFRGRINKWLVSLDDKKFKYAQLLTPEQYRLIQLYFYPKKGRWLNQEQVAVRIKSLSKWKVRDALVTSLIIVWEAEHNK
jgi:hypothetical protein